MNITISAKTAAQAVANGQVVIRLVQERLLAVRELQVPGLEREALCDVRDIALSQAAFCQALVDAGIGDYLTDRQSADQVAHVAHLAIASLDSKFGRRGASGN